MSFVRPLSLARRVAGSSPVAVAALIVANLVPLAGVLLFGWDVMTILVLYWIENGIVGLSTWHGWRWPRPPRRAMAGAS